jgi:hypothetical protein
VELTKYMGTTELPEVGHSSFGPPSGGRNTGVIEDSMVDVRWEICIAHWVPDDQSLFKRLRWFLWDVTGLGNPPSKAVRATAEEVTTVTADTVPTLPDLPNRRFVKALPHSRPGAGSREAAVPFGVLDHS